MTNNVSNTPITTTDPVVSVVIPTHNSAAFLAESVSSVLAQTYRNHEVIVIDDGSSDDTQEVLKVFGSAITYVYQDNGGPSAARNAGIRIARGEFICLLDADDSWTPNKLELQTAFMATHADVGLLFADAIELDETRVHKRSILATMKFGRDALWQRPIEDAFRKLLVENFVPTSTVMMRKAALVKAGLFDESLHNAEDRDMWLRLSAVSGVACVPQVLARKRSHDGNISHRTEVALRSRIVVWAKARREWPGLASAAVYQRMLAGAYQELGYIELTRGEGRSARKSGIASLRNGLRCVINTRSTFRHPWLLSIGLIPLSLVPWPLLRSLWSTWNYALGKGATQWPGPARAR